MGGRLLRQWLGQPLLELAPLPARQDGIEAFYRDTPLRTAVMALLGKVGDLERLASRAGQRIAAPRELTGLRGTPGAGPRAAAGAGAGRGSRPPAPADETWPPGWTPAPTSSALIAQAIADDPPPNLAEGGVIRPGFSAELDGLHAASRDARQWIAALERTERERTGIKNLKVGYNKVFGYYIEITAANVRPGAGRLHPQADAGGRRALHHAGPEGVREPDPERPGAAGGAGDGTSSGRCWTQVAAAAGRLRATAARPGRAGRLLRPGRGGRAPPLRPAGAERGRRACTSWAAGTRWWSWPWPTSPSCPTTLHLSNRDAQLIILTGPNMAGKSHLPAPGGAHRAHGADRLASCRRRARSIGLVDRIFTRVGAQDDIATGQSTFMVEMVETANILHNATARSLIILDEIGRGTSTYDGLAIARAVVEYIHNHPRLGGKTLFATHYHELTELAKVLPRVRNFNVAVAEEGDHVVFLRRIVPGGADRSYGIHVAQLAGLPRGVIRRAEEILEELEKDEKGRGRKERLRQQMASAQLGSSRAPDEERPARERRGEGAGGAGRERLSPLEALTKLYELQRLAANGGNGNTKTQRPKGTQETQGS